MSKENSAIESNIFAYCKNNAANYIDPFGKFAIAIAASAITVETIFWIVAACAVIYTAYVILSNPSVQRAIAKLITAAGTSIKSQISTVSKEIAKALAKAKKKSQKKKYEKHHIVAKSATAAGPSRAILKKHGIGINSNTNLVSIKYNLHRHLHTKSYYTSVNNLLKKVQGSKKKVLQALTSIKSILLAASMAAP